MEPIILASGSLRRQEFFRLLDLPFNIMPALIDENYEDATDPRGIAEDMALKKVNKILDLFKTGMPPWICGADTIISVDGIIFGKPKDRDDAKRMLTALQGRKHDVVTAIALYNGKNRSTDSRTVVSTVTFAPVSEGEIEWYLNTGEWQGIAGAYKIQGLAGCYISEINGSYSSIVGLPIREFYVMLRESGYPYGGNQ
ncbi:MAG: Maf family protein [Treponema sp.]|jgi:septum formation protein|nr:Maf family protein [Treponema sp.]